MYIFPKESYQKNDNFFYELEKLIEEVIRQNYPTISSISNSNPPSFEYFNENGEILYKKTYYNAYVEYAGKLVSKIMETLPPEIKNLYQED